MHLARSLFPFLMVTLTGWGNTIAADRFTRGDVDQSGRISITDAVHILEALFGGGSAVSCEDAADVDDNGSLTVTDPVFLLESLFRGGLPPALPFPGCGEDPSPDGLSCEAFEGCMFTFEFYGEELSADAVIFVTDQSVAMRDSGELNIARMGIVPVIEAMPDGTLFATVFFDAGLRRFPDGAELAIASDETRASGRTFVNQLPHGSGTCGGAALLSAIESARLSGARRKLILYVSGGDGICTAEREDVYLRRILEEVTLANSGLARIYTFPAPFATTSGKAFLRDLAERNGGSYVQVY